VNELERRLVEAAPHYPFPATPDMGAAVLPRLPDGPRRDPRPLVVAVAGAAAALAAVLAFSSGARGAMLDWLDAIPGVHIERVERLPRSRLVPSFDFGRPVSLAAARRNAGFAVRLPASLGRPSRVFYDRTSGGSVVTLQYDDRLALTEWRANVVLFYKMIDRATRVRQVEVGGATAYWLQGGDHAVFYIGTDYDERSREGRLAGNVLVWQAAGVGYRLEAEVDAERAVEIAESLE
jgi:hypothetical protein